jgi:hypothetical protein
MTLARKSHGPPLTRPATAPPSLLGGSLLVSALAQFSMSADSLVSKSWMMLAAMRALRSSALISSSIVAQRLRLMAFWKLFNDCVFCSKKASMSCGEVRRWGTSRGSYRRSSTTLSATASGNL